MAWLRRFGVYESTIEFGGQIKKRPAILVSPQWYIDKYDKWVLIVPCSAEWELYLTEPHFVFENNHPDFASTGFDRRCYAAFDRIVSIRTSDIGKLFGNIKGNLLQDFTRRLSFFLELEPDED